MVHLKLLQNPSKNCTLSTPPSITATFCYFFPFSHINREQRIKSLCGNLQEFCIFCRPQFALIDFDTAAENAYKAMFYLMYGDDSDFALYLRHLPAPGKHTTTSKFIHVLQLDQGKNKAASACPALLCHLQ